ncbi:hypothetical protein [Chromobacterium fluminis]|uniref:hypothetical protein n=1 Tax=Chromobacterium fluminis TaxID=3044269 RepID=UPI0019815432|nr:hypothetical protein [Chromobacterium haemolyticum]
MNSKNIPLISVFSILLGMFPQTVQPAPIGVGAQEQIRPYLQVKQVPGDENIVRVFFSPGCQFSKQYFQFFTNLERTLPERRRFLFTPLVNKGDGLSYALSVLAVERFYPAYTNHFIEASLIGVQDRGLSARNWAAIDRVGRAAHLPKPISKLVYDNIDVLRKDLQVTLEVQQRLGVTNTPSVSVAGTYIITPEFTAGDSKMFSQLVNAVISMSY